MVFVLHGLMQKSQEFQEKLQGLFWRKYFLL